MCSSSNASERTVEPPMRMLMDMTSSIWAENMAAARRTTNNQFVSLAPQNDQGTRRQLLSNWQLHPNCVFGRSQVSSRLVFWGRCPSWTSAETWRKSHRLSDRRRCAKSLTPTTSRHVGPRCEGERYREQPCGSGRDATRRNVLAHVASAIVADRVGPTLPSPLCMVRGNSCKHNDS
jgi:hypothetical protein